MTKHLPEDVRRQQILDAARSCFVEKGYYATRMEDIALAAGLSKGGLYFHFESKLQVFNALVRFEYEQTSDFLQHIHQEIGDYEALFEKAASHFLEFFRSRPDYPRFFIIMGEMAVRDESVRQMLASLQQEYTETVAKLVEGGIESGALKQVDPHAAATLLKGTIDSIEALMAIGVNLDMEKVLSTGLEIVLHGILNDASRGKP